MPFSKEGENVLVKDEQINKRTKYEYEFLKRQRDSILAALTEIDDLIAQADSLGVKEKKNDITAGFDPVDSGTIEGDGV